MYQRTPRIKDPIVERQRSRQRDADVPWRRWYKLSRWQRLRFDILVRDEFTCQLCGYLEGDTSRLVADHIKAHRGAEHLFWDASNLQCVCSTCHNSVKQSEDRTGRIRPQIGLDGWPVLPVPRTKSGG